MTSQPRIKLPATAARGEVITIKTLINHAMESGQRRGPDGALVPRRIINRFTCAFNGETVFECDLAPAIAASPYLEFRAKVPASGSFTFTWIDDDGTVYRAEQAITVT